MYASILLQEYFTDPNVAKCNNTLDHDKDYEWINACERYYREWTFGNKFSKHSKDMLGLVAGGLSSHALVSVVMKGGRALNRKLKDSELKKTREYAKKIKSFFSWFNPGGASVKAVKFVARGTAKNRIRDSKFYFFLGFIHIYNDWWVNSLKKEDLANFIGEHYLNLKNTSIDKSWEENPKDECILKTDPEKFLTKN